MRRIRQHDGSQFTGHFGSVNKPLEAVPAQFGDKAAMIDMGMSQENPVNIVRIEEKILIIQAAYPFRPLKHPAIDQEFRPFCFE